MRIDRQWEPNGLNPQTVLLVLSPFRILATVKNLLLWRRLKTDPKSRAVWDQFFSESDYLQTYPDVANAGTNPQLHFLLRGNDEYRLPSPRFDLRYYLDRYPDVRASGVNALLHFAMFGTKEDRTLNLTADTRREEQAKEAVFEITSILLDDRIDHPLVSVVIPCLGHSKWPERAVEGALQQTLPGVEIIVVSSGESKSSLEASRLESRRFPNTRFCRTASAGLSDLFRAGASHARGRYICCISPGEAIKPVTFEVAVFALEASGCDFVARQTNSVTVVARRGVWAKFEQVAIQPDLEHFWLSSPEFGFRDREIREPLLFPMKPDCEETDIRSSFDDSRPGFLLALPFVTIGGAETLFRTIGKSIVNRGERLVVVTSLTLSDAIPADERCFEESTPHVYNLSRLFENDFERRQFVRYLIRRYRVRTMILAGSEFMYHSLPDLSREFPELVVVDQIFNNEVHVFNNRHYANFIDATVVPSEPLRQFLIGRGADPASVATIPHGIGIPTVESSTQSAGNSVRRPVIAYFGRLSPEKGPDVFVQIAKRLLQLSDCSFVMTGEGSERDRVLRQIRDCHLEEHFHTPGFVPDLHPLMCEADIVVLPSRVDGMPLVVLEALAAGKAVVASRVGSLPNMIADGESGFLCDPGDVEAFCDRVLLLVRDPELRHKIGLVGRKSIEQTHNAETMLQNYHELFQKIRTHKALTAGTGRIVIPGFGGATPGS
jgi:glycosyltransferase involved in cell wall biosynthesis